MRQLQLIAHGEPSDVIKLNTVAEPGLGQEDVLISLEAAPLNPSDFMLVRGRYGVRPTLPFSLGSEGVGRVAKVGSKVDVALQGKRADPALRGSKARTFPSARGWRSARSSHRQPEGGPPCLTCTLIYPGLIPSR